jgi:myo-inositol-1-phosphate synthase
MNGKRIGAWLIGALGSISTTLIVGTLALRKGLTQPMGMITTTSAFSSLGLAGLDAIEFGGCDIRCGCPPDVVRRILSQTQDIDPTQSLEIEREFDQIIKNIGQGTARNCGDAIEQLAAAPQSVRSLRKEVSQIRESLRQFKEQRSLATVVVVNLASTEPPLRLRNCHQDLKAFESCLDRNDTQAVKASTIYAYAAVLEGCPYINFTPSNGALIPAIIELAERSHVPIMGNDGKTGETLVKSALAPMFTCRNLEVLSWEGFNILGNMDGSILEHAANRESKIKTKDQVLGNILGYAPHSRVHIDYVPSLDDQKTAWDFIHFKGFLGVKMSLQFIWQGYDSILAAPLILDLVRLAEYACRRGEGGLMPQLASFFKAPLGVDEYRLSEQHKMLLDYVWRAERREDEVCL